MTIRIGQAAVDWARNQHYNPSRDWTRDCLMFVRSSFNVGSRYGSAATAYANTNRRHTSWPPPKGVPVWFNGPTYFDHVALSIGDGTCWTNDYVRRGKIDRVGILTISRGWGAPYRGWSEDINEVRIYTPPLPIIDISNVVWAAKNSGNAVNGVKLKAALAAEVGRGSMVMTSPRLGVNFRVQYRKLQVKWYGSGDGIPGATSLTRLCRAHGLSVRA